MKRKFFAFLVIIIAIVSVTSGCAAEYGSHYHYRQVWRGY